MKRLLRILFLANKRFFTDLVVEEFFGNIPRGVSDPGISVTREQYSKFDRWLLWQAYVLQVRMRNFPKEAEKIFGMLLQIKMMAHMMGSAVSAAGTTPGVSPAAKAREAREAAEAKGLEDAMAGVGKFMKRGVDAEPAEAPAE